jgi:hypothetical protein
MRRSYAGLATLAALFSLAGLVACEPTTPTSRSVEGDLGLARVGHTQGDNCWADFDADGRPDLLALNHGDEPGAQVILDEGTGPLIATYAFPARDYHSCAAADFNGDGLLDVYLGTGGCEGLCGSYPKRLYLQQRSATGALAFSGDVAAAWHADDPTGRGRDAVTLDVNGDRRSDLFVANEEPKLHPSSNHLYINTGGAFADVTTTYGIPAEQTATCADSGDTNGDGLSDLVVCGGAGARIYQSAGKSLIDVTPGNLSTRDLKDARFADLNGDHHLDLVATGFQRVFVRVNDGQGRFPADTWSYPTSSAVDLGVGDADGDGDVDIYVVNRWTCDGCTNRPDALLLNSGGGTAFAALPGLPTTTEGNGDSAEILPSWRGGRGSLIVVNNGRWTTGPRQAIKVTGQ